MAQPDPYELLGIERGASAEEVRAAFRRKVRQNHPDTAMEDEKSTDVQDIIEAYRLLIDPGTRAKHDSDTDRRERGVGGRRIDVTHRGGPVRRTSEPSHLCGVCRGSGIRTEEISCPACHGRGEITALDRDRARMIRCRKCSGRGRVRASQQCAACDGSGISVG